MTNENEGGPPGARRQRPPTVIDLPATEVPLEVQGPSVQASAPPPPDPLVEPPPRVGPDGPGGGRGSFAAVGGVFAGVAGGLLVAALFWWFGAFPTHQELPADPGPRLAAIEKQVKDLAGRPAPVTIDPNEINKDLIKDFNKSLEEIAARVARLESAQAAPRSPVTDPVVLGRMSAVEGASKSVADNVAALSRRAEATDAAIRDTNVAARDTNAGIGKLSAALAEVRSTARADASGTDHASRLAIAAEAMRNAVERGDPFAAELIVVRPLTSDANALAALKPFAAAGVPGNPALGQELAVLIRPMLRAPETPPATGGFLHKLRVNAEKLVRIHRVDGPALLGDDRGAILVRAEQRASQGDVAGAITELAKLSADDRALFQAWIGRTEARNNALDASRRVAADAVAALKDTP